MYIRCAFFRGHVRQGFEEVFTTFVHDKLAPLWTQFPGAEEVRVMRQEEADVAEPHFEMVLAIRYPSKQAIELALASDVRTESRAVTADLSENVRRRYFPHRVPRRPVSPRVSERPSGRMDILMSSETERLFKSQPTMADVAELAGVSTMTVSRALRKGGSISEKTRRKIMKAVDELGYVLDQTAGTFSSKRSGFIAALVPSINNSNFADTARGVTEAIENTGLQLLLGYTDYQIEKEEWLVESMLMRRPEGVIVTGGRHADRTRRLLESAGVPSSRPGIFPPSRSNMWSVFRTLPPPTHWLIICMRWATAISALWAAQATATRAAPTGAWAMSRRSNNSACRADG